MKKIIFLICLVFTMTVVSAQQTNQTTFDLITCQSKLLEVQNILNSMDSIQNCTGDFVLFGSGKMAVFQVHFYTKNGIKVILNTNLWEDWDPELHKKIVNISGHKEVTISGKLERTARKQVVFRYAECEQIIVYLKVKKFFEK